MVTIFEPKQVKILAPFFAGQINRKFEKDEEVDIDDYPAAILANWAENHLIDIRPEILRDIQVSIPTDLPECWDIPTEYRPFQNPDKHLALITGGPFSIDKTTETLQMAEGEGKIDIRDIVLGTGGNIVKFVCRTRSVEGGNGDWELRIGNLSVGLRRENNALLRKETDLFGNLMRLPFLPSDKMSVAYEIHWDANKTEIYADNTLSVSYGGMSPSSFELLVTPAPLLRGAPDLPINAIFEKLSITTSQRNLLPPVLGRLISHHEEVFKRTTLYLGVRNGETLNWAPVFSGGSVLATIPVVATEVMTMTATR